MSESRVFLCVPLWLKGFWLSFHAIVIPTLSLRRGGICFPDSLSNRCRGKHSPSLKRKQIPHSVRNDKGRMGATASAAHTVSHAAFAGICKLKSK